MAMQEHEAGDIIATFYGLPKADQDKVLKKFFDELTKTCHRELTEVTLTALRMLIQENQKES